MQTCFDQLKLMHRIDSTSDINLKQIFVTIIAQQPQFAAKTCDDASELAANMTSKGTHCLSGIITLSSRYDNTKRKSRRPLSTKQGLELTE